METNQNSEVKINGGITPADLNKFMINLIKLSERLSGIILLCTFFIVIAMIHKYCAIGVVVLLIVGYITSKVTEFLNKISNKTS